MAINATRVRADRTLAKLEVPGIHPDGSIPLEMLSDSLKVEIPAGSDLAVGQQIQLYLNGTGQAHQHGEPHEILQTELDDPGHRFELSVDKRAFPVEPGKTVNMVVEYGTYDPDSGTTQFSGKPVTVIFDREAPGGGSLPLLNFTYEQVKGINEDDMTGD